MSSLRYRVVLVTLIACVIFAADGSSRSGRDGIGDADLSLALQLLFPEGFLNPWATMDLKIVDAGGVD